MASRNASALRSTADPNASHLAQILIPLLFVNFSTGGKGGVGKSFFCRVLYQYYLDHHLPTIGFEGDVRTPDFAGIYTEIKKAENAVHFSEDENQATEPNIILNAMLREKKSAVVNMPAAVDLAFKTWLQTSPVLELAAANGIQLVNWFVVSGEYDSTRCLQVSLKEFGNSIPHVIVRNKKFTDWSYFDEDDETQKLIQKYNCKVIDFPKLNVRLASILLKNRLRYDAAQTFTGEGFDLVEQSTVTSFLRSSYQAIESTGYLPSNSVNDGGQNGRTH